MRLIMFAGKGGTGKTTLAAATGALTARRGRRTLIMSLDPAHSLRDAFELPGELLAADGEPTAVADNLWIQEINLNLALTHYWREVHSYLALLFNTAGLNEVVAEEIAVLPGMEEITALLYLNEHVKSGRFDALILDCAPTAESIRFVSLPTALDWYMQNVFRLERGLAKAARPLLRHWGEVPLPGEKYFASLERLHRGLAGVQELLTDRAQCTVRLVSLAEKLVLRETQRALTYFCLHGLSVEAVLLNRIWSGEDGGADPLSPVRQQQQGYLALAERFFAPLPLYQAPRLTDEALGHDRLLALAARLYGDQDPLAVLYGHQPLAFTRNNGHNEMRLHLPFASKEGLEIFNRGNELIIQLGMVRRHVALPASFPATVPSGARYEGDYLVVSFPATRRENDAC
ncbi:MAG: TRC40/GET3/ArsA family transport-energizing ATPase [Deltaproteobacteria bacterium]|nr:TRC40/GET3/ArsA family transport-energizing ATPase [Deltaproteobacteria bacterium]